jgi:6-phosphogluconolactonase
VTLAFRDHLISGVEAMEERRKKTSCAALTGILAFGAITLDVRAHPGVVFTSSNAADGNQVLVFRRGPFGRLTPAGTFDTDGAGTGGGLGNQGAVTLSHNGRWLLVVNAGSNEVSVFRVHGTSLTLTDVEPSGGELPVSVTIHDGLVYVLNAMDAGNVSGFTLDDGDLVPLPDSTRPLSGAAQTGGAQIQFSPNGSTLVVTERLTNVILTYDVGDDGLLGDPVVHPSIGMTPFGFDFAGQSRLIVSEAFGGMPDASAVSSYRLESDGDLTVISPSAPTTQTAACSIEISKNRRFAYTTNTGSGSITGYRIGGSGQLTLLDADGETADTGEGSAPTDLSLTRNGLFLYALNAGDNEIDGFFVNPFNGRLWPIGTVDGIPAGATGLASK